MHKIYFNIQENELKVFIIIFLKNQVGIEFIDSYEAYNGY